MDIKQVRINNLKLLIAEKGTAKEVADLSGTAPAYISQLVNARALESGNTRSIGHKFARDLEAGLAKPHGWMDIDHSVVGEEYTPSYSEKTFTDNSMQLGPLVLTLEQAACPPEHLARLSASNSSRRAPEPTDDASAFAIYMEDDSMKGSDERELALMRSWQKGDLLVFVQPPERIEPGRPVAALLDGQKEVVIRVYRPGLTSDEFQLIPLNSLYNIIDVNEENKATIVGALKSSHRSTSNY